MTKILYSEPLSSKPSQSDLVRFPNSWPNNECSLNIDDSSPEFPHDLKYQTSVSRTKQRSLLKTTISKRFYLNSVTWILHSSSNFPENRCSNYWGLSQFKSLRYLTWYPWLNNCWAKTILGSFIHYKKKDLLSCQSVQYKKWLKTVSPYGWGAWSTMVSRYMPSRLHRSIVFLEQHKSEQTNAVWHARKWHVVWTEAIKVGNSQEGICPVKSIIREVNRQTIWPFDIIANNHRSVVSSHCGYLNARVCSPWGEVHFSERQKIVLPPMVSKCMSIEGWVCLPSARI